MPTEATSPTVQDGVIISCLNQVKGKCENLPSSGFASNMDEKEGAGSQLCILEEPIKPSASRCCPSENAYCQDMAQSASITGDAENVKDRRADDSEVNGQGYPAPAGEPVENGMEDVTDDSAESKVDKRDDRCPANVTNPSSVSERARLTPEATDASTEHECVSTNCEPDLENCDDPAILEICNCVVTVSRCVPGSRHCHNGVSKDVSSSNALETDICKRVAGSQVNGKMPIQSISPQHRDAETLMEELKVQKLEMNRLREENDHLQKKLAANYEVIPLSETTADIYEVQMAALEKTITQLQRDVDVYRDKLTESEEGAKNAVGNLRRDLSTKLEKMTKRYETAEKDKEAMVVKYAQSEKAALSLKKSQEEIERKLKENAREKEMLLGKVRTLTTERARLNQIIDTKTSEVNNLQRDVERLREESMSKDIKVKWAQNKLKTETDSHKETISKLEKTQHKLTETREEAEQIRRDCQAMICTYQESEEIKSNSLDLRLREKESELKMERQEKSDQDEVYQMNKNELDALKKKHKLSIDENNALTMKVQSLERERLDYEQNLSKLKEQLNSGQQEIVDLQAKLAEMDNLKAQIVREKEKIVASQTEIERLRQTNVDLQIDMEACRRKEGELLEFTERLTSKNVILQSDFSCLEAKVQVQDRELNRLNKLSDELEQKCSVLAAQLLDEQQLRKQETQILARKLAEKTRAVDNFSVKLDEQNNENKVIKRKHASSVRELTREVQTLRRRLDNYECRGGNLENQLGSRTSSTGSLDTLPAGSNVHSGGHSAGKPASVLTNGTPLPQETKSNIIEVPPPVEPTRQMLIERIVKLQRAHARKNEKIDFLEEHVNHLLSEIKKKTKVIQNYVMRDDAGVLSTISMDQNKAELSKKGGIMASLYTSHPADDGMTMELSLEISGKLQAVLEDTLLKNITLKENIKTLGDEIERLIKEKRQLKY